MNRDKFVGGITIKGGYVFSFFAMNEADFMGVWTKYYSPHGLTILGDGGFDTQEAAHARALEFHKEYGDKLGVADVPIPNTLDYKQ